MIDVYHDTDGANVLAVMDVERDYTPRYGIITPTTVAIGASFEVASVVEKPKAEDAPSTLAVIGRYILHSDIFAILENQMSGVGGEIQLTDAFKPLLETQKFYGCRFSGTRFDCGSKAGYVSATLTVAQDHPEICRELDRMRAEKKVVNS
jgi:UTP--glucose-1-phosphate uridylyltransferase